MPLEVRPVVAADHDAWSAMFEEYRSAAGLDPDPVVTARLWSWVQDPAHPVRALVAVDGDLPVGFAHARRFPRPILADEGLYLDDLFTRPVARGRGVARALLHRLAQEARAEQLGVLRWTTRPGNVAARRLYDDLASVADSVTYDLRP